jgi:hypothetical protein
MCWFVAPFLCVVGVSVATATVPREGWAGGFTGWRSRRFPSPIWAIGLSNFRPIWGCFCLVLGVGVVRLPYASQPSKGV